jgi:uncharacterized protein (TIGR02391 family)
MLMLGGPEDEADPQRLFGAMVVEPEIVEVSRDLFVSGHFSLAIQEACKALEKLLQDKSGNGETGTVLMDQIFSPKSPTLAWSVRKTKSQVDEQLGYHRIYGGAMLGIRNPCTHEFNWVDDGKTALEILVLIQHLLRKARSSSVVPSVGMDPEERASLPSPEGI